MFTWTNLLVVVVELDGNESEALDLVPLVTSAVLEEHHLIVGVAVVVDPGVVPINSRGEKQRMHLRDGFLADLVEINWISLIQFMLLTICKALEQMKCHRIMIKLYFIICYIYIIIIILL